MNEDPFQCPLEFQALASLDQARYVADLMRTCLTWVLKITTRERIDLFQGICLVSISDFNGVY